ncbi:hypothetical protein D3C87_1196050 [compost metagenome]
MNGLKLEPGWRQACVTWLNLLRLKSKPPTIARISPSSGFNETKAAATSGSCVTDHVLSLASCVTRMIAPGRILTFGWALADSDGAINRSAVPSIVATSPESSVARTCFGVTLVTTAERRSSLPGCSTRASSMACSRSDGFDGRSINASGPR